MAAAKPKTLRAVRPNVGVQAWYRSQLDAQITAMHDSLVYWLSAEYRANGLAMDADGGAALAMRGSLRKLSHRWQWVFDKLADSLSRRIADRMLAHADSGLKSAVKGEGFAVKFTMTPDMGNAYQAVIGEQVGLIRSIAQQHLSEVEGLVMRSVAQGRDLGSLTKALQARYGVTKRRAALIARDQNNKATSVLVSTRQQAIGITQGVWRHSHAGKTPRPSHVKADGATFDLKKGLYLEGEWVLPGQAINCRCTWQPVIPGFDD